MNALRAFLAAALVAFAGHCAAQPYPSKPVNSRAEFAAFVKGEIAKWSKVAKDSGAKAD